MEELKRQLKKLVADLSVDMHIIYLPFLVLVVVDMLRLYRSLE